MKENNYVKIQSFFCLNFDSLDFTDFLDFNQHRKRKYGISTSKNL